MKKKIFAVIFCLLCVFASIGTAACSSTDGNEKLSIVTTIFPEYDWVKEVLGEQSDNVDLILLQDDGVDLHNYQPTVADIATISTCDLFIYVGGESDDWVDDALSNARNKDMKVINLMEVLGDAAKEEEIKDGMQSDEEDDGDEEEETEYDEHVWLSLKNAKMFVTKIAEELSALDLENAAAYEQNAALYISELDSLDNEYQSAVNAATCKTLLFGDRFPFRYLVDDYSLDYFAAFLGCSAETEASFETIVFLANKVDELNLTVILTIEGDNHRIAQTIKENTAAKNQQILTMNSLQSITSSDVENGVTYLSLMSSNLEVLKQAIQ